MLWFKKDWSLCQFHTILLTSSVFAIALSIMESKLTFFLTSIRCLIRNAHLSVIGRLEYITQNVSSLTIEHPPFIAIDSQSTITNSNIHHSPFTTEQSNAMEICAGIQGVRSNHMDLARYYREQTQNKHTLIDSVVEHSLFTIRTVAKVKHYPFFNSNDPTLHQYRDQDECEMSYTIHPAVWLLRLGIHHGLRLKRLLSSTQGWKSTLEIVRLVPNDALIFEYCKIGDESAIKKLLSKGHASVRDTDSEGFTPLHVSLSNKIEIA